jgi:hypothetical protein
MAPEWCACAGAAAANPAANTKPVDIFIVAARFHIPDDVKVAWGRREQSQETAHEA